MKITDLNYNEVNKRFRISARVTWEDCDREPEEIYFESESDYSQSMTRGAHPFVVASIFPALYSGEKRLKIDEEICPKLKEGLITAMHLLHHWWYPSNHSIVAIEAKKLKTVNVGDQPKRSSFCFSGGIDSLSTLYFNRIEYPESHPGYFRDGLIVFGLEVRDIDKFQSVLKSISAIAEASHLTFVPVYTNIVELGPKNPREFWNIFWTKYYESAAFSAIAHAFSNRWESFTINSSDDIPNLIPSASDPLLTSFFSSWDLRIKTEGIRFSRFDKTELISKWDVALKNLRVCNVTDCYQDGILNCGTCEKCVRTMLALEALNALKKATTFPSNVVTSELVHEAVEISKPDLLPFYLELLSPLEKAGRDDLKRAISAKIKECYKNKKKKEWELKTIQPIIDFDKKHLKGNLKKLKNLTFDHMKAK